MASRLQDFLTAVTAARNERAAEHKALLSRLKAMTPEEFVRQPREVVGELTDKQYADVVQKIAPDRNLAVPPDAAQKRPFSLLKVWSAMPTWLQAVIAGLTAGLPVFAVVLLILPAIHWWQYATPPVRSLDTLAWPHCARLNEWVDGCTYTPRNALTWHRTAGLLGIAEQELRQLNRHIPENYIPAGATIVVWRHRGILQGENR